jgi:hypothetical protein
MFNEAKGYRPLVKDIQRFYILRSRTQDATKRRRLSRQIDKEIRDARKAGAK